jgi:CBS domain-containing protein
MLRARDVMRPHVHTVHPEMPLAELEEFFVTHRIHAAPVLEHGTLVGIVTRSDVVRIFVLARSLTALLAEGAEPPAEFAPGEVPEPLPQGLAGELTARCVRDAMVADPLTASPDTLLSDLSRTMVAHHIHQVLVTECGQIRGIVSSMDLVRLIADGRLTA